jgi:AraC family transcriptional regulator
MIAGVALRDADKLRALVDVLVGSVEDPAAGAELARRAHLSRFHFDRLVAAALGESPATFRRRLLLERAAYELASTDRTVIDVAFGARYASAEAFARAFRRAFGSTPTTFRDSGTAGFTIAAPNGVHFHPPGGLLVPGDESRRKPMSLPDRMVEHDNWRTKRLIESAMELTDDALDEPVSLSPGTDSFQEEAPSIRSMLNRLVFTKEMWAAAISGRALEETADSSLPAMLSRLERSGDEFGRLVRDIDGRGAWHTAFVDATCDPPQTFTFGGAVAHVLTRNAARSQIVAGTLRDRGVETDSLDPIAWERRDG